MDKMLTDIGVLKQNLRDNGFFTKKALGQNFLVSSMVAEAIVEGAAIEKEDVVVEIGPGIGSLTQYLLPKTENILAIELDQKAIPVLLKNTREDLQVINEDVLKVDILGEVKKRFPEKGPIKVVANLPYYITTPILMYLLEEVGGIDSITVMVQKEVGERMLASPGNKTYGALTLAINYYTEPSLVVSVPKNCFYPIPKVDSLVVHLQARAKALLDKEAQEAFFKLVRSSFNQRRKTLSNSLLSVFNGDKEAANAFLEQQGIDPRRRGETLSLEEFMKLSQYYVEERK